MPSARPTHRKQRQREHRPAACARGYNWAWSKPGGIRDCHLAGYPLCEDCKAIGRITRAVEVDHIDGDSGNNAGDNLRSLCKSHHSRKTVRENGGLGH